MNEFKVAFIGAGPTMEQYIKVLRHLKSPKIKLLGIYSRTRFKAKKLQKKYKIKFICKDIDELYKKTKADVLFSVVSVENIGKVSLKATKYPWKIFTEKPFGINYINNLKLAKNLKNKKKQIFVGFNRAFLSSVISLLRYLKNDRSKRIINVFDQQNLSLFSNKKYSVNFKKNLMFSNSIHLFTIVKLVARGNQISFKEVLNYKNKTEKFIIKKITFSSGDVVIFNSIWNRPGPWKIDVSTSNNYFSLNPLEKLYVRPKNKKENILINESPDDKKFKPGFKKQIEFFFKRIEDKKSLNFKFSSNLMKLIHDYFKI